MLYMAKSQEKIHAQTLRRSGMSINKIAEKLLVSKCSVSLWCRDLSLTQKQQTALRTKMIRGGHKGRMMGAKMNMRKRVMAVKNANKVAKQLIKNISKRDLLILGLGLYWGEGNKNTENRFILVNSDPFIIKAMFKWLREVMGVPKERLTLQIYINEEHKYRIEEVSQYWSTKLKIHFHQFRRPVFVHATHKKTYANHETYMGVLHLYVQKSSALKYATMGMLSAIKSHL